MREPEPAPDIHKVRLKLISPERPVFIAEIDKILLPCLQGDRLILPRHAPCFCAVKAGKLIAFDGNTKITLIVSKGVAEIRRNICAVMAWGILADKIKRPEVEEQLALANKILSGIHTHQKQLEVLERIHFLNLLKNELDARGE